MITGIGTDVCRVSRIEEMLVKFGGKFAARVVGPDEEGGPWEARALARRWAIKEAVAKAFGSGIGEKVALHDIVVRYSEAGQPLCSVRGCEDFKVWVSTSDDGDYAVGMAVVEQGA